MSKFLIEPVPVEYQHAVGGEWAVNDYAKDGQCAFAGSHEECEAWVARDPMDDVTVEKFDALVAEDKAAWAAFSESDLGKWFKDEFRKGMEGSES